MVIEITMEFVPSRNLERPCLKIKRCQQNGEEMMPVTELLFHQFLAGLPDSNYRHCKRNHTRLGHIKSSTLPSSYCTI